MFQTRGYKQSTREKSAGLFMPMHYTLYHTVTVYTGCPRRNVPDFGRVFLKLKYTDITQNTYIQS